MQLRNLRVIGILLLAMFSSQTMAQTDQKLMDRYDRMYAAQKYELALKAAETICDRHPQSGIWHFFAGALLAMLDRGDEAIEYLQVCADRKYTGIASFEQNSDLDSVREREDFKSIIQTVRINAQARMNEFQAEAKKHVPQAYYPDSTGVKMPLVIALHGTGMDGKSMFEAIKEACVAQEAILIAPDALRPAGNGFSWTYRDESKWFVNYLIEQAVKKHDADPDRVILIGFSQGANIALILGQTQPEKFAGVVPICGHYEAQNAESTATPAPFYLISGARDPWKKTYIQAKKDFAVAGGRVQTRILTGKGHQLPSGKSGTALYQQAIIWSLNQP